MLWHSADEGRFPGLLNLRLRVPDEGKGPAQEVGI